MAVNVGRCQRNMASGISFISVQPLGKNGVIDKVFNTLHEEFNVTIVLSLDNTYVKAHPDGTGCQKNGPHSIGETRGGKNTKIHVIVANEKAIVLFHLS